MRIREEFGIFWRELTAGQKAAVLAIGVVILFAIASGWGSWFSAWREARRHERDAVHAKAERDKYIEKAAKIGREKLEQEKQLKVLEAQKDGQVTKTEAAEIRTYDALLEYERTLRESAGDGATAESNCARLAALGYPCS